MKLSLILHNIRSTYNVGAILRTAEGFGVDRVIFSGYTPRFDDQNLLPHLREKLNHQIAKSALGAEKIVKMETVTDLEVWLDDFEGLILGLENNVNDDEAGRLLNLGNETLVNILASQSEIALILGEEVAGIPTEIRSKADYFVQIPMQGQKESFNVSVATGIAVWGLTTLARTTS